MSPKSGLLSSAQRLTFIVADEFIQQLGWVKNPLRVRLQVVPEKRESKHPEPNVQHYLVEYPLPNDPNEMYRVLVTLKGGGLGWNAGKAVAFHWNVTKPQGMWVPFTVRNKVDPVFTSQPKDAEDEMGDFLYKLLGVENLILPLVRERHLIHYAKGWNKRGDVIEDLKILFAEYFDIEPKDVDTRRMATKLWEIVHEYMALQPKCATNGEFAIKYHLIIDPVLSGKKISLKYYFMQMLYILDDLLILDGERVLINIGEPDFSLLPAASDTKS
jgi:hypothetical protein